MFFPLIFSLALKETSHLTNEQAESKGPIYIITKGQDWDLNPVLQNTDRGIVLASTTYQVFCEMRGIYS